MCACINESKEFKAFWNVFIFNWKNYHKLYHQLYHGADGDDYLTSMQLDRQITVRAKY